MSARTAGGTTKSSNPAVNAAAAAAASAKAFEEKLLEVKSRLLALIRMENKLSAELEIAGLDPEQAAYIGRCIGEIYLVDAVDVGAA